MKISQVLDKIDDHQLFVPAFQREYVWKRENVKKLISSLIKEHPVGTLITWETNTPPELKGGWKYNTTQGSVKILLDGQQRITSLYMLVRGKIPYYYKEKEIKNDTRGLYINIETLDLQYYQKQLMENNPRWINITKLFQKKIDVFDVIEALKKEIDNISEDFNRKINENIKRIEKILDLDLKELEIPVKAKLKEAIDIFYIVNSSGVNLTDAELALAQISGFWPTVREEFKSKLIELKKSGFIFKLDFLVFCLLGTVYCSGSEMKKLHNQDNGDELKETWKLLKNDILDYVVNILKTHAFVDHTKEINSVYALIPIIVYIYNKKKYNKSFSLSEIEIKKIVKWFYYSQIRQRYISQLPQKLDKDIKIVTENTNPFDELLNIIKLERNLTIIPDEFVGAGINNALYSLMRWYFKSKNAVCFTTGIGIRQNMGEKYKLEWDHIFPYSILKEKGYSRANKLKYPLAQEITNRAVLTETANRSKNDSLPEIYLKKVKDNFPNALSLQSIPENEMLWKIDNFEMFLKKRREMLSEELNNFLKNITKTEESQLPLDIQELIFEGESEELEFKPSLRWSCYKNKKDKTSEITIMKSISAFSNAEGGTLLIGVSDEGKIIGLEQDYISLIGSTSKNKDYADKDDFELHLRQLIENYFDKIFAKDYIKITFPKVNGQEICQVDILPYNKPLYIEITDKHGNKQDKLYVRSGHSSKPFDMKEANEYVSRRFRDNS